MSKDQPQEIQRLNEHQRIEANQPRSRSKGPASPLISPQTAASYYAAVNKHTIQPTVTEYARNLLMGWLKTRKRFLSKSAI